MEGGVMIYISKRGFTLAEVLITLGIIGIVAAMTLPSIINNARNKQLEAQLKKSQSVITQGLQRMAGEDGQVVNSINYPRVQFNAAFKKYFYNAKDCGAGDCVRSSRETDDEGSIQDYIIKNYRTYNNLNIVQTPFFDDGQFQLNDGSMVLIENPSQGTLPLYITVDINGMNKKPNRWGHDLFTFNISKDGKLLPMGAEGTPYYRQESTYCSATSINRANGIACTFKALTDKDYWKNLPK